MLKHLLTGAARRLADDARSLGTQLLPPARANELAAGAVRALTRNWPAATALAELASARHAASHPTAEIPTRPRVLLATRFGAQTPTTELVARELLAALGPRDDLALTLCATRDLLRPELDLGSAAGAAHDALLRLMRRHRVLDATTFSAAHVARWVADHDVILTCNDFAVPTSTPANVELAVMALGFARAMGREAHAMGLLAGPDDPRVPREARAFLARFARKALLSTPFRDVADAWREAGFRVVDGTRWHTPCPKPPAPRAPASPSRLVLAARSPLPVTEATAASAVTDWLTLGRQVLAGHAAVDGPRPDPSQMPALAEALAGAGHGPVTGRVQLGRGPSWWGPGRRGDDLVVADGTDMAAFLSGLAPEALVVTDCPELALALALMQRPFLSPEAVLTWLAEEHAALDLAALAARATAPALVGGRVSLGAWLALILPQSASSGLPAPVPAASTAEPVAALGLTADATQEVGP